MNSIQNAWPELSWEQWKDTADTLHMFTQVVGKTRLALTPVQNHWWNAPLYISPRGLTTSAMPIDHGNRLLGIEFDFVSHALLFRCSSGLEAQIPLQPKTVAAFFAEYQATLALLDIRVPIDPVPVEVKDPIHFAQDATHCTYDPDAVQRFWRILCLADTLLKRFSTNFYGKISPVHFFWGSFDLAVTRFNGKRAPARPELDHVQAEAYSHECISAGFWPGNGGYGRPAFYTYGAPTPPALADAVLPGPGKFNRDLGEFILDYDDARLSPDPAQTVLDFLAAAYSAAANAAHWDRANLDRTDAIGAAAVTRP